MIFECMLSTPRLRIKMKGLVHDVFNLKVYNPINNHIIRLKVYNPINNHIIRLSSNKIPIKSERTGANALEVSHWNRHESKCALQKSSFIHCGTIF